MPLRCGYIAEYCKYHGRKQLPTMNLPRRMGTGRELEGQLKTRKQTPPEEVLPANESTEKRKKMAWSRSQHHTRDDTSAR